MLLLLLVRSEVDSYIGIDYSLLKDPVITDHSLDMDFRVSEFPMSCFSFVTNLQIKFVVAGLELLPSSPHLCCLPCIGYVLWTSEWDWHPA